MHGWRLGDKARVKHTQNTPHRNGDWRISVKPLLSSHPREWAG